MERRLQPDRRVGERRGRRARTESPTRLFNIRLSEQERARLQKAAHANHQNLGDFARDAIVTAADDCLEADS